MRKWEDLPENMRTEEVRPYYDLLWKKRFAIGVKRAMDVVLASVLLVLLSPVLLVIAMAVKIDSKGHVFYRQERVTRYGKRFRIHKFRSMIRNADRVGAQITVNNDARVTRVGRVIRKYRLDELGQLLDVLNGTMSFVGTRPEVPKYVDRYTPEMLATLLLPAGVTSEASIRYKDEATLIAERDNVDETYVQVILPEKMVYNLKSLKQFSLYREIATMFRTVLAVLGKDYH